MIFLSKAFLEQRFSILSSFLIVILLIANTRCSREEEKINENKNRESILINAMTFVDMQGRSGNAAVTVIGTAAEAIAADKAALAITYAGSDSAGSVTQNVILATTGSKGTTITWASDTVGIIAANGTVTRPIGADATVVLTATISKSGGTSATKVFTLTVIKVKYTIGGTITGLTASELVLQNNAGDNLTVTSGATSFTFSTGIASGAIYVVTVQTQPTGLTCTVTNGTGNVSANVSNVALACFALPPITRNWGTFTDNGNGTVQLVVTAGTFGGQTYTAQTLTWMKCSHGQAWKSSTNDCTQNGTATTYGATTRQYCDAPDSSCIDAGTDLLNGTGVSAAFTACNALNAGAGTYGKTNWRVPIKNELKLLIECTNTTTMPTDGSNCGGSLNPSINNLFPNTVGGGSYWSSNNTGTNAWYVAFSSGSVNTIIKTTGGNIRCVSGP